MLPLAALLLLAAMAAAGQSAPFSPRPVYVFLFMRVDDHINVNMEESRWQAAVDLVKRTRKQFPDSGASLLMQFTGATALECSLRDAGRVALRLRDLAGRQVIELGYDGSDEPAYLARPMPNFRGATTSQQRWLARLQPAEWFLTEYKDLRTGEPDPERPGGLKFVRELFGPLASITGFITMELGGDSEFVHIIRRMNPDALLPGIPEPGTWPARNLNGFGGSAAGVGRAASPAPDCAPELFWQDHYLRLSDNSGAPVRVVRADEGPEALKELLGKLDRSRPHVIKVVLEHHGIYVRPEADGGLGPARYAYDHPKTPSLDPPHLRPQPEVDAAHARQEALLKWLGQDFFPANPGSRFVTARELKAWTAPSHGFDVPHDELRAAAAAMMAEWRSDPHPPDYARSGKRYFSLADMFQMLATSLAGRRQAGSPPASVRLNAVYGPLEMTSDPGSQVGELAAASIERECARIAPDLNDGAWRPVPRNAVPGFVTVDGVRLNASQFLRLMAQAFLEPRTSSLKVTISSMFSSAGFVYPRTRPMREEGAMWTLKPAPLAPLSGSGR
ncbi:MAG: hypothetical protein ACE15B_12315 [Bryobacteraceae bacterium]